MPSEADLDAQQPSENPGRGIAPTDGSDDDSDSSSGGGGGGGGGGSTRSRTPTRTEADIDAVTPSVNPGLRETTVVDQARAGFEPTQAGTERRAQEAFSSQRERARQMADVDDPTVSRLGAFEPSELDFDVGRETVTISPTDRARRRRGREVSQQRVVGAGPTETSPDAPTDDGLGTIADVNVPGTDSTVLEVLDRGGRAYQSGVVDPLAESAREIGEADTMLAGSGMSVEGSEARGELFSDFARTSASALNVPGFGADLLRLGPASARAASSPERARAAVGVGAQLGREAGAFAQQNPARTTAMLGGLVAGAGVATGAARGARAGARRASEVDLPSGSQLRREVGEFGSADRGQLDIGGIGRRQTDDSISIDADDIAPADDFDPQRVTRAEVTRAPETPIRRETGSFSRPWSQSRRPIRRGEPDDFRRPVEEEAMAQDRIFEGLEPRQAADADTQIPADPLDTSGGLTPTGGGLFEGAIGAGAGAGAMFGQLSEQATLGDLETTPSATLDTDAALASELGFEVGTGLGTGLGDEDAAGLGEDTTTESLTGAATDEDIATLLNVRARTALDTLQAQDALQVTAEQSAADPLDPTRGEPTRTRFRPPRGPPQRPPRVPVIWPDADREDDPLGFGTESDDAVFGSGIASAEDIWGDESPRRS